MSRTRLGRGKHMTIAQAALVVYYRFLQSDGDAGAFLYTGDLEMMHDIVDVAGANHCGPDTKNYVIGTIAKSPLWEATGRIKSWGNKWANTYTPSEEGKKYFDEHLTQYLNQEQS